MEVARMQQPVLDAGAAHEAQEIAAAAEAYLREVARKSHRRPQQVEPVVWAALTTLLDWAEDRPEQPSRAGLSAETWPAALRRFADDATRSGGRGREMPAVVVALRDFLVPPATCRRVSGVGRPLATIAGVGPRSRRATAASGLPARPKRRRRASWLSARTCCGS
jgi:hypothetical protein